MIPLYEPLNQVIIDEKAKVCWWMEWFWWLVMCVATGDECVCKCFLIKIKGCEDNNQEVGDGGIIYDNHQNKAR